MLSYIINFYNYKNTEELMLPVEKNKDIIQLVNKLSQRIQKLNSVQQQFINYILKLQHTYEHYGSKISGQMVNFQEDIAQVSLYSSENCSEIMHLSKILRHFFISIRNNAEVNLLNFKRVDKQKISEQESKLMKKSESFISDFIQYCEAENVHNKIFSNYDRKSKKLDQILRQFQDYSNPLNFYNESATESYLKDLQLIYSNCVSKEADIITDRQVLDQKRKWLGEHLKEVTQAYVLLLHHHLVRIENVSTYITDSSKDRKLSSLQQFQTNEHTSLEVQIQEFQKLNHTYKKNSHDDDDIFSDFSALFKDSVHSKDISHDYKFFQDRCENFGRKKLKNVKETVQLRRKLLKQLNKINVRLENFERDFVKIEKQVYGITRADNHKKRFRKYFGQNFSQVEELCFTVIQRPKKSLQKLGQSIKSQSQRLGKICEQMQTNTKTFERRMNMIFEEHAKIKAKVEAQSEIDPETFQKFKNNIMSSFNEFKSSLQDLYKSDQEISNSFQHGIRNLINTLIKEMTGRSLSKMIEKEVNRVNILKSINIDSEVIGIIKQDTRYEILFSEALKPNLSINFISQIQKRKYEETIKILQKKELQSKNMLKRTFGCCGMINQPIANEQLGTFTCQIIKEKLVIPGNIYILSSGIRFKESNFNIFKSKTQLLIPSKQITGYEKKISVENNKEILSLETTMGSIAFLVESIGAIVQKIQKLFPLKPKQKEPRDRSIQVRDRKNSSNSSFLKLNNSTEYKISFEGINNISANNLSNLKNAVGTQKNTKKVKSQAEQMKDLLRNLAEKIRHKIFFSEQFGPIIKQSPKKNEPIRIDYDFQDGNTKFKVKQRRELNISQITNFLFINFEWKISFPQFPMLNSFRFREQMRVQMGIKTVKLIIQQGVITDQTQFLKRRFFQQVNRMNGQVGQFIMRQSEKQVQVCLENENSGVNLSQDMIMLQQMEGPSEVKFDLTEIEDRSPSIMKGQKKGSVMLRVLNTPRD